MRPVLVVNPRTDTSFMEFVHAQVGEVRDDDPSSLESLLRKRHPAATVHVRLLSSESSTVWYVYRDGHWTSSS